MSLAFNILVIILSVFLAIFLLAAIIIAFYTIKGIKAAKKLTDQAGEAAADAKNFMNGVKAAAGPAIAGKLVKDAIKNYTNRSKVKVKK
jgi:uncharacterized protein (UPF0333 family)